MKNRSNFHCDFSFYTIKPELNHYSIVEEVLLLGF